MSDTVCVLLSTYNGKKYLEEQLKSLVNQKNVKVDVLVRDDGSTDGTQNILDEWQRLRGIKWYQGENCGPAHSFMKLIESSDIKYDYYAFCDQDDVWKEDKLFKAIKEIKKFKKEDECLYHSRTTLVDQHLNIITSPFRKPQIIHSLGASMVVTTATGCTMVWNKALMEKLKLYIPNYMVMHDNWVYVVCRSLDGNVIYDDNSYILYRQHENNVLGNIEKQHYSKMSFCRYQIVKFFDTSCKNSLIAQELLNGYETIMPEKNKKLVKLVAEVNDKIMNRMKVVFNKSLRVGYWPLDLQFCWKVLIGKS